MDSHAAQGASAPGRGSSRASWAAFAAVLLLAVAAVAGVSYLPTNDGPRHLFSIHASQRLELLETGWARYFDLASPTTSRGFGLLFGPLDRWLPWDVALRLALGVMVALWAGGSLALARAVHPGRDWLGVLLAGAGLQWTLYMGFFSFYVATAAGLWILAFAVRPGHWGRTRRGLLAVLLLEQALLHVAAAVVTGLVVACVALARSGRRGWLPELARVAGMGLPAGLVAVVVVAGGLDGFQAEATATQAEGASAPWWALGRCFLGGPAWRAWPLSLLACVALLMAPRAGRAVDRALLAAGGVLLLCAWWMPLHLPVWHFFSARFLPTAVAVLLVTLPVERLGSGPRLRVLAAACVAFALASTGWAYAYNRQLERRSADAISGLRAAVLRDGPRLPVNLDPALGRPPARHGPMPFAVPMANLGHLYALAQGGVLPHNFAVNPRMHHLLLHADAYDRYPPVPPALYDWAHQVQSEAALRDPDLRAALVTRAASFGAFYQDVVWWGRPEDVDLLVHRGYAIDWRQGGLALARFEGCPLTLTIDASAALAPNAAVLLGWYPLDAVARRIPVWRIARRRGDRLELAIDRAPCGAVWLGIADADATRLTCAGADDRGRLVVPSTRKTPRVACRAPHRLAARRGGAGANSAPVANSSLPRQTRSGIRGFGGS